MFRDPLRILVSIIAAAAVPLHAEVSKADTSEMYVIDMQRILDESIIGKKASDILKAEAAEKQEEIAELTGDVQERRRSVQKQAALLSAGALDEKLEELKDKEREVARTVQDFQAELDRRKNTLIGKIVKEVDRVITELAEEKGYGFILERDKRVVVYASEKINLSSKVIKLLNKRRIKL